MRIKTSVMALGLTSSLALFGCGEDSTETASTTPSTNTTPTSEPTSYSVKAIDGYLRNALVWLDINENHQLDDGEPSATTGEGGAASLDTTGIASPENFPLMVKSIANQTIDEDEPDKTVPNDFILSAPPGVAQVTPLTTLVHIKVLASDGALTADEAKKEVAESLGVDEDLMYSDYKAESSTAYQVVAFAAKSLVTAGVIPETLEEIAEAAADTDGNNDLLNKATTVSTGIKTKVDEVNTSGDSSSLDNVVINSSGSADVDTDGDGVPDEDDFDPEDATEWKDTDKDGYGDNSDAFPNDPDEYLDEDSDGYGDTYADAFPGNPNEWADTDEDGYGDNSDAFPSDPDEYLDEDSDGYGDTYADAFPDNPNEWSDSDGDNVGDNSDAFPNDPEEWLDTDGDEIGNKADTDDDGDGILDDDDADPLDANVGSNSTVAIVDFLSGQSVVYSPWEDEDDFDSSRIYIETLSVNGSVATTTDLMTVKSDKSEVSISVSNEDLILTPSGWSSQTGLWAIDFSGTHLVAYPTDHSDITYTLNGGISDLTGLNVATSSPDFGWDSYADLEAIFPSDSYAISLSLVPNQDVYYIWDWQPYIAELDGQGYNGATSLDELIFEASTIESTSELQGVSVGSDIFVKFVGSSSDTSGTAEYYSANWTEETVSKDGEGTWTRSSDKGADLIEFTVPQTAIDAWGDAFDETATMIVSEYDGAVYIGSKEVSGETLVDDSIVLVNEIAKNAIIGAADISLYLCATGNSEEGAVVTVAGDYEPAVSDCGGAIAITSDMVVDQNFYKVRSNGDTRDYFFNSDGTITVYKNGGESSFTADWTLESGYLKVTYDDGGEWYWALMDSTENQWSLKFFESYDNNGVTATDIWASTLTLQDLNVCTIQTADDGATYEEYAAQISAYDTCKEGLPSIYEGDLIGSHLYRDKSNGETRAYVFEADNVGKYYKSGTQGEFFWRVTDGVLEFYDDEYATEPSDYFTLLKDVTNDELSFAIFTPEFGEIWLSTLTDVSYTTVEECTVGNAEGWDEGADKPLYPISYADYQSSVAICLAESETRAEFSSDLMEEIVGYSMITMDEDVIESYTFDYSEEEDVTSGTGTYAYSDTDGSETHSFTWSIDGQGRLEVVITDSENSSITYTDYLYIVDSDGVNFSLKARSHSSEWGADEGDVWSGVFTFEAIE